MRAHARYEHSRVASDRRRRRQCRNKQRFATPPAHVRPRAQSTHTHGQAAPHSLARSCRTAGSTRATRAIAAPLWRQEGAWSVGRVSGRTVRTQCAERHNRACQRAPVQRPRVAEVQAAARLLRHCARACVGIGMYHALQYRRRCGTERIARQRRGRVQLGLPHTAPCHRRSDDRRAFRARTWHATPARRAPLPARASTSVSNSSRRAGGALRRSADHGKGKRRNGCGLHSTAAYPQQPQFVLVRTRHAEQQSFFRHHRDSSRTGL